MTPLARARERIAAPERWTQGSFAKNAKGNRCDPQSKKAVCWCLYGAIKVSGKDEEIEEALRAVWLALDNGSIALFNDTHTHAEVLALLDRALTTTGDEQHG